MTYGANVTFIYAINLILLKKEYDPQSFSDVGGDISFL